MESVHELYWLGRARRGFGATGLGAVGRGMLRFGTAGHGVVRLGWGLCRCFGVLIKATHKTATLVFVNADLHDCSMTRKAPLDCEARTKNLLAGRKGSPKGKFGHGRGKSSGELAKEQGVQAIRYTADEALQQKRLVESMLTEGMSVPQIQRAMRAHAGSQWPNFSLERAREMAAEIRTEWEQTWREEARGMRVASLRRHFGYLRKATRDADGREKRTPDLDLLKFSETMIAKIGGLMAPERVVVSDRAGQLGEALRFMTPEQLDELRAEYRENVALAKKARAAGLEDEEP